MLKSMVSQFSECCVSGYLLVTGARVAGDNIGVAVGAAGNGHAELGGGTPNNLGY